MTAILSTVKERRIGPLKELRFDSQVGPDWPDAGVIYPIIRLRLAGIGGIEAVEGPTLRCELAKWLRANRRQG